MGGLQIPLRELASPKANSGYNTWIVALNEKKHSNMDFPSSKKPVLLPSFSILQEM